MKLSYNGGNLRGEIACIHVEHGARPLKRAGPSPAKLSQPSEGKYRTENEQKTNAVSSR